MDVRKLKAVLHQIEELYSAGGAATAAKDLRSVARLLDGYEETSVEAFIAETKVLLDKPPAPASSQIDVALVSRYSDRLLEAGTDEAKFEAALKELDEARGGKGEWAAIANRYRNAPTNGTHVYKFKSIREARIAVRDTFIERHEASSKRGIIDRLTKWAH
jgi:hypothetical protein